MNENKKSIEFEYGGKKVTIETGRLAKQADGSVIVSSEGTSVLVTVCSSTNLKEDQDFFPLTVDYTEKFYAAGKFLGGFNKREGRPTVQEILNSRLIDRPLRPLFPEDYKYETVIQATVLSYSPKGDPEILAGLGASSAVYLSDIPFNGPVGTCKIVLEKGQVLINPDLKEHGDDRYDIEMILAGTEEALLMVEGEANEVSEEEMLNALKVGHEHIKTYCAAIKDLHKECGRPKREYTPLTANNDVIEKAKGEFSGDILNCLEVSDKRERGIKISELRKKMALAFSESPEKYGLTAESSFKKEASTVVEELLYEIMRKDILESEKRIAGRKVDEIRAIETEVNVLTRPHGSSLFTRGETQVMGIATLGGSEGEQLVDSFRGTYYDKFYLHYAFPPFCVGEARGVRGVSRREQGHGNLAYRALKRVIPEYEKFPYTIRVNCEVLESNGSSSMGSVCSGSMALMDAGVPIKSPVAGIAMGLIKEGDQYKILSDILGDEDHLGDMDFKVAGTSEGITAIQMDIKIEGITEEIFKEALSRARDGRLHILNEMAKTISETRTEMKEGVPRFRMLKIPEDKIGALIGPGGKNIKKIEEVYSVRVEVSDNGTVKLVGPKADALEKVAELVNLQMNGPEIGKVYKGNVVSIKEYGAFVDIAAGVSGLLHISEIANSRIKDVHDYLDEGDPVDVKVLDVDNFGKIKFSAKAVKAIPPKEEIRQ